MRFESMAAVTMMVATGFFATACTVTSSGTSTPPIAEQAQSAVSFCSSYCGKVNTCDRSNDKDTCESKCENANASFLPKLRADIVSDMTACIEAKDCSTVLAGKVIGTCAAEAAAEAAPTDASVQFCDALVASSEKCDVSADRAKCLSSAKLYNDSALAKAKACTQKACTEVGTCITAALGSLAPTPPPPPPPEPDPEPEPEPTPTCSSVGDGKTFDFESASCDSCMAASCCSQTSACANDSTCIAFGNCYQACTTDACESACVNSYPSGASKFAAVASCYGSRCSNSCK